MNQITITRMNRYYRWFLKHYNKKDKTYLFLGHPGEHIYIYGHRFYPLGIIIGQKRKVPEWNMDFFNLEYIRIRKKKQGLATKFLIKLIELYDIKSINYLPNSISGKAFFNKMQGYLKQKGIEDLFRKEKNAI